MREAKQIKAVSSPSQLPCCGKVFVKKLNESHRSQLRKQRWDVIYRFESDDLYQFPDFPGQVVLLVFWVFLVFMSTP